MLFKNVNEVGVVPNPHHFMSSDLETMESESLAKSNRPAIKRPRKPMVVFYPSLVSQKRINPRRAEPEDENPSE